MSPSQFNEVKTIFAEFIERFDARLRRVELLVASLAGGATVLAVLVGAGVINL